MKHEHGEPQGSPFDFKMPITCPECVAILWAKRAVLCEKYGWIAWPDDLNQGRDYIERAI